jgi:PAS domain S-box-containing protein
MADDQPVPARDPHADANSAGTPETRLAQSDLLARLFDALPATIWTTDTELRLTFLDGWLRKRLPIEPSRLIGRSLPDLLMEGREDHPLIGVHRAALDGHENSLRIEWGDEVINARVAPLRDPDGRIIGCVGVQQVVAWLPEDETTMRESDIRLQRMMDSNMLGIAFGNDEGLITEANDAFLELAGYTAEDLANDAVSWPALAPVEFHQRQLEAIDEVRRTGRCAPFETDLIRKDGGRVTVLVGAARLSARRREGFALVLDVTERKQLRQRMRAELSAADALLDATSVDDGIRGVLCALCADLGWTAARLWRPEQNGQPAGIASTHGDSCIADPALAAMAREAADARETMWSATSRVLLIPLQSPQSAQPVLGVAILTEPPGSPPSRHLITATEAVVARLARYISRT